MSDSLVDKDAFIEELAKSFHAEQIANAHLRSEVERLTRERDEALALLNANEDAHKAAERKLAMAAEVLRNFEIKKPDDDGLVWLVFHGNGTTGKGMINLGDQKRVVAQVALHLEDGRSATLAALEKNNE